jgi:hypothetical protein
MQLANQKSVNKKRHAYWYMYYWYPRQAEFLHEMAVLYEIISGIDQWWIGLTDLGKPEKVKH